MQFTNIPSFENRMNQANVDVAFFTVNYANCTIEAIYSRIQRKFLFAIVDKNIGFTCSLNGIYASAFINHKKAVEELANCRNSSTWNPKDFYEVLNEALLVVQFSQATMQDYKRIASKAVSNFEDRIFFNHWRIAHISTKQYDKTVELMGYDVANFCQENGVTAVYFPYPTDRTFNVMQNFVLDYEENTYNQ